MTATTVNTSMGRKKFAMTSWPWYMSSGMPSTELSEESLIYEMKTLPIAGIIR